MNALIDVKLEYRPVLDALNRAAREMADTRPLMEAVAGIMFRAVEDNFEQEGRPRWKDLAPSTRLSYAMNGKDWRRLSKGRNMSFKDRISGRLLQRSTGLASSISQRYTATSAMVGTNKIYAAIHQFGGRIKPHVIRAKAKRALSFGGIVVRQVNHPGSNIPARPFLSLTPGDQRAIVLRAREFQWEALARNGLVQSE